LYDEIINRGFLRVGICLDSKPFGFKNEKGEIVGYDADLARYIAQYIIKSSDRVEFVPVTISNRLLKATTGEVDIVISTVKTGAVTGVILSSNVIPYDATPSIEPTFVPYLVRVTADVLNVRAGAGTNYKITTQVRKYDVYTIIAENGKWGKLKSGDGWIHLDYTKRV
jgi:ABC-type amino acid transport substrate-binding protein